MSIPTQARQYVLPKFEGIQSLTVREVPVPKPKVNKVLVKIHAVSLNYRDLIISLDKYPLPKKEKDLVPCSDLAGEIVSVGEDVKKWRVGDRVCANFALGHIYGDPDMGKLGTALGGAVDGGLTEYAAFPEQSLVKVPDYMTYEEASTLPCAAVTAYNGLCGSTPVKGGDWVLVQGTGGVSIFGLQLAVALGANVIATSSSDEKLKLATKLGAKHTVNYKTTPDWEKAVLELTGGRGVDHVIEVGGPGTFAKSLTSIRMGGSVYVIGFLGAGAGDDSSLSMQILSKAAVVRGVLVGSVQQFEDMNRLLTAREIHPVIDRVFEFEEAQEAYKHLQSQKHVGKIVIRVTKA